MSLETIISYGLTRPDENLTALVLMGGGARTAYQTGLLQAVACIVAPPNAAGEEPRFPFKILVGTSAGALNACYLASRAGEGLAAFKQLAGFWATLRSAQVYQLNVPGWIRSSRIAAALFLSRQVRKQQAFLNDTPLVDTLRQMPREVAAVMPYRSVDVLAIAPSQSLDALAQAHAGELPAATYNALAGLGALGARGSPSGAALASYLQFEPGFIKALMALGERDAHARKDELMAFFGSAPSGEMPPKVP